MKRCIWVWAVLLRGHEAKGAGAPSNVTDAEDLIQAKVAKYWMFERRPFILYAFLDEYIVRFNVYSYIVSTVGLREKRGLP